MANTNALTITKKGFTYINEKLIGSRIFEESLITAVGSPVISKGVARDFSEEDYLTYAPLNFEEATKITISFKGQFFKADFEQCMWELESSEGTPLSLTYTNNEVRINLGLYPLLKVRKIPFEDDMDVEGTLILGDNTYDFTFRYGTKTTHKTGYIDEPIDYSTFIGLNVGSTSLNRQHFWYGFFDLTQFFIYRDDELIYTPSSGTFWTFSKILVSDGEFKLTDNSIPLVDHIFEFPVKTITTSGNTTLVTTEINENSNLNIRDIGLYIDTPSGQVLFGSIGELNIKKAKDVTYELIFTVNTTFNIVNAVGFPAENGIVVGDPEYVRLSDMKTIKEINLYVLTNLERIIRENAEYLGYNTPQNNYRLQQQLELDEGCYNTLDTFARLIKKFHEEYEEQLSPDVLIHGEPSVLSNGDISGFTNNNFVSKHTYFENTSYWNIDMSFSAGNTADGTIFALASNTSILPLKIYTVNNMFNLDIGRIDFLEIAEGNDTIIYYRDTSLDALYEDVSYFAWASNVSNLWSFHIPGLPVSNSAKLTCPLVNAVWEHEDLDVPDRWRITINAKTTSTSGTQYILKSPDNSNKSIELSIENKKAHLVLFDESTNDPFIELWTRFELELDKFYTFTIVNIDGTYSLRYEIVKENPDDYPYSETIIANSTQRISLDDNHELAFGSSLTGVIDFENTLISVADEDYAWKGAAEADVLYTTVNNPTTASPLYDSDFYELASTHIQTAHVGEKIVSLTNAFEVYPNTRWRIMVQYNSLSKHYTVSRVFQTGTIETIFDGTGLAGGDATNNMINLPKDTILGVTPVYNDGVISEGTNPFTGIVHAFDCSVTQGENTWTFSTEALVNNKKLLQDYRVADYERHRYSLCDLCDLSRKLKFLNNKFTGNKDLIDFDRGNLSLCVKVHLEDMEDKDILFKSDLFNNVYFSIKLINQNLTFILNAGSGDPIILEKYVVLDEYLSYTKEPILVTVTSERSGDGIHLIMYKNNEFLTEFVGDIQNPVDASEYVLSNYIESSENVKRRVSDIILVQGILTSEDLFYINNLYDTNY